MRNGHTISTAVMARRVEPPDSLDWFPTPPWATRALMKHVLKTYCIPIAGPGAMTVLEPACGAGHMARTLLEYFGRVEASDVHDYGFGAVADFLWPGFDPAHRPDWIITNPPFRMAEEFIAKAIPMVREGVAMFVRTAFLEGIGRWQRLYRLRPPKIIAPFVERVPLNKGVCSVRATTATAYMWLVWGQHGYSDLLCPPRVVWIPPCRKQLEEPGDYDDA